MSSAALGAIGRVSSRWEVFVSRISVAFLCGYVVCALLACLAMPVDEFDDSIPLVGGLLVQQGRTPNLDFYEFYPPLSLYVNAAAFNLFGRTVVGPRLVAGALYVAVILGLWKLLKRRTHIPDATAHLLLLFIAATFGSAISLPSWPGAAMALLALIFYFVVQGDEPRLPLIACSGVLTGVAILYRVNFGAYAAAVIAADMALGWFLIGGERWKRSNMKVAVTAGLAYGVATALTLAAICFWIYGLRIQEGTAQFIGVASKMMTQHGFVNLVRLKSMFVGICLMVLFPPGWFVLRMCVDERRRENLKGALAASAAACILLCAVIAAHNQVYVAFLLPLLEALTVLLLHLFVFRLGRQEFCWLLLFCLNMHYFLSLANHAHWRYLPPMAATVCALWICVGYQWPERNAVVPQLAIVLLLVGIAAVIYAPTLRIPLRRALAGPQLIADVLGHRDLSDGDRILGPVEPGQQWKWIYPEDDDLRALRYFRSTSERNEPIFEGVQDHSTIHFNNLRIYWLAGRPFGSRWFQLEARIASEPDVQRQIMADLEQNQVRRLIIDRIQRRAYEESKDRRYTGSSLLDQYIAGHYSEEIRFERYSILRRE